MENGPFIDDFPIKTSIYKGFSIAMLNNQRVNVLIIVETLEVFQCRDHLAFFRFSDDLLRVSCISKHSRTQGTPWKMTMGTPLGKSVFRRF